MSRQSDQTVSGQVDDIAQQWWERRGSMVYGEDYGPGTATHVMDCATAAEAQRVVDDHNAALARVGGAA